MRASCASHSPPLSCIDIIRWRGPHYVPGKRETGRAPGTDGASQLPALDDAALARHAALATSLEAAGWSLGYCRLAADA